MIILSVAGRTAFGQPARRRRKTQQPDVFLHLPSSIFHPRLLKNMPDDRRHRGPHPEDADLFSPRWHDALRAATADLSWLLTRDYATPSALKIVGDRYNLSARQRTAVMRCACPDQALASRRSRELTLAQAANRPLLIDGYNVLTTIEAAMAGGVLIVGRDRCWRDMASMHGTWRRVEETTPAIRHVGHLLATAAVPAATWYLDSPVSNSGRLKAAIEEVARHEGWNWQVQLTLDPDKILAAATDQLVATADSVILDRCGPWLSLAKAATQSLLNLWLVDFAPAPNVTSTDAHA